MKPCFVVLATLLCLAASPLPGVGEVDPRRPVDAGAAPWTAVARLNVTGVSRCSAFLVGPRLALTAAHCLYGRGLGHMVPPKLIHVLTRYVQGSFAQHSLVASYKVLPGYDPARPEATRGADVAELTLAEPMIAAEAALKLAAFPPPPGTPAMLGGYNQDRAEIIEADATCHVGALARDGGGRLLRLHDCAATRGTSGAPLLVQIDGRWVVVGVNVAGAKDRVGGLAVVLR